MINESDASPLDRLLLNCEYIAKFCRNNRCEANERLRVNCVERLVQSSRFFDKISSEFFFKKIPQNGFVQFLKIATIFTDQIANQIKAKNQIDRRTRKLFESIIFCADWLTTTCKQLKSEKDEASQSSLGSNMSSVSNGQHLIRKKLDLRSKHFYELINSDDDVLASKFTRHLGFWLPTDIRRTFKTLNFVIALICQLPWSLATVWSEKYLGKYIAVTYQNVDLNFPFNVWHLSEHPFIVNLVNSVINFGVPVHSETVNVPRQKRFRLDCKGNILDFEAMTEEQIAAYFDDETEQARQNSPGLRHRNGETVKCRYSYIRSKEKIAGSLERIKNKTKPTLKVLKYYTARVSPDRQRVSDEINNNYETKECSNLEADFEVLGDPKDDHPQQNDRLLEELGPNPERVLLIWIHGGGLLTQGAKSCETYLRKIVNALGGVNCLALDYSLTVPYPVPLQEVLDVYLWALSGRADVEEKLGFQPKKIVLSGDSGGGYFACCLTIVLNELIKMLSNPKTNGNSNGYANARSNGLHDPYPIPSLPLSLVTAYPAFSISNFAPSKTLFTLEPLVEIHMFMLILSIYGANLTTIGDFKKIEKSEAFQRIVAKNRDELGDAESMHSPDKSVDNSSPWFKCDYATFKNYADYIDSWFDHPFINPLLYEDKFHELKDVALFTFSGTYDFLMDDSIELARMWKGKTTMDLFLNAVHGILSLISVSTEASEAFEIITLRFQEACGLS